MKTDPATRARIAAMSAAETAFEKNNQDPFSALDQISEAKAEALAADPEMVQEMADEIVAEALMHRVQTHSP